MRMEVKPTSNFGEEFPEFTKTELCELAEESKFDESAATHLVNDESTQLNLQPLMKDQSQQGGGIADDRRISGWNE